MASSSINKIEFHFISKPFYFTNRRKLKAFILYLFKKEAKKLKHINYIFCSDEYLLNINQLHLSHDTYTDIITFDLSSDEYTTSDIYISAERVKDNCKQFSTSFKTELHRVIFHGALHLCGYNDKNKKDIKIIREKEEYYLNQYFRST